MKYKFKIIINKNNKKSNKKKKISKNKMIKLK